MNKITLLVIAALALCGVAVGSASAQSPVPLYRYENESKHEDLLTTKASEFNGKSGWAQKGTVGYVFTQPSTSLVTLYYYYNASIGDHFYSTNYNELRDGAAGWVRRDNAGYVFSTQVAGSVPLYRFTNPAAKHFYTTNKWEGEAKQGFTLENITAYIYPASFGGGPVVTPGSGPTVTPGSGPTVTPGPRTDVTQQPGGGGPSVTGTGRTDVTSSGGRTVTLTPR